MLSQNRATSLSHPAHVGEEVPLEELYSVSSVTEAGSRKINVETAETDFEFAQKDKTFPLLLQLLSKLCQVRAAVSGHRTPGLGSEPVFLEFFPGFTR